MLAHCQHLRYARGGACQEGECLGLDKEAHCQLVFVNVDTCVDALTWWQFWMAKSMRTCNRAWLHGVGQSFSNSCLHAFFGPSLAHYMPTYCRPIPYKLRRQLLPMQSHSWQDRMKQLALEPAM